MLLENHFDLLTQPGRDLLADSVPVPGASTLMILGPTSPRMLVRQGAGGSRDRPRTMRLERGTAGLRMTTSPSGRRRISRVASAAMRDSRAEPSENSAAQTRGLRSPQSSHSGPAALSRNHGYSLAQRLGQRSTNSRALRRARHAGYGARQPGQLQSDVGQPIRRHQNVQCLGSRFALPSIR
jgi:hypothetical protein